MNTPRKKPGSNRTVFIIGTLIAVSIIAGILYKTQSTEGPDPELTTFSEPEEVAVVQATVVPEAEIPQEPAPTAAQSSVSKPPALPGLNDSDSFIRERLALLNSKADFGKWIQTDDLIRRTASYFDGLSNGVLLNKVFPLTPPEGKFATHADDNGIWLNAGNYERYDRTIGAVSAMDMTAVAKMFHFSRPLLEAAFAEMGYNSRQMDGIILQSLDVILATPIIVEPIELTRESVVYKFADPALESLLPLQKQLLRAGPENTKRLQQQASALREALLNP
jgi:hypothetical protein